MMKYYTLQLFSWAGSSGKNSNVFIQSMPLLTHVNFLYVFKKKNKLLRADFPWTGLPINQREKFQVVTEVSKNAVAHYGGVRICSAFFWIKCSQPE